MADYLFVSPASDTFFCSYDNDEARLLSIDELRDELQAFDGVVRTTGHPANTPLLDFLWSVHSARKLEFCSEGNLLMQLPAVARNNKLQYFTYATNHGVRWFKVSEEDAAAIHLAAVACSGSVELAIFELSKHPAWPALSFISTVHAPAVCSVLGLIGDIRFFYHPTHSGRTSTLMTYLGVRHYVMRQHNEHKDNALTRKLLTTITAWAGSEFGPTNEGLSRRSRGHFLSRVYATAKTQEEGLMRATQLFVQYLRMTWLGRQHQTHFEPELFFQNTADAAAYRAYMADKFPEICVVDSPVGQH